MSKLVKTFLEVFLVGMFSWILIQVYEMKGTLSSVDQRLNDTKERVNKIVEVLPDLRIKLAMREVEKLFQTALIVTKPIKTSSGEYKRCADRQDN